MKTNMKMYQIVGVLLLLVVAGWSQEDASLTPVKSVTTAEQLDTVESAVKSIMSKAGIHFSGEFKSRALSSKMGGFLADSALVQNDKKTENVLYTSVDLSITARPLDALGGSVIFRLHEDWQNMFASMQAPITARWISLDGNAKNIFRYNVGDFKAKFSPLTLWAPENDLLYEAYIFDRQKQEVMGEEFLGDNNRVLQGVNFNFGAQITPVFNELSFSAYGARLNKAGRSADISNTMESIQANALVDRYSTGGKLYVEFLEGISGGATFVYNGDAYSTFQSYNSTQSRVTSKNVVIGGNLGFNTAVIKAIDTAKFNVDFNAEFMASIFNEDTFSTTFTFDSVSKEVGIALDVDLDFDIALGSIGGLQVLTGFNMNDLNYKNEMAQSPTFFRKSILNTQFGEDTYNVFDAMYKHVFSYMPAEGEAGVKQPARKIAYTRGVLTQEQMKEAYADGFIETELNASLPFGEATANRIGAHANIKGDFLSKAVLAEVRFSYYNENNYDSTRYPTGSYQNYSAPSYLEVGGGASVDIAKLGNWWAFPFVLSGSFMHTTVNNAGSELGYDQGINLVNAGLYFQFWKRLALLGGYQVLSNDNITIGAPVSGGFKVAGHKRTQSNWAAGLEYTVVEGGVLTGTVGQTTVEYAYDPLRLNNFNALQFDLFLTVQF